MIFDNIKLNCKIHDIYPNRSTRLYPFGMDEGYNSVLSTATHLESMINDLYIQEDYKAKDIRYLIISSIQQFCVNTVFSTIITGVDVRWIDGDLVVIVNMQVRGAGYWQVEIEYSTT